MFNLRHVQTPAYLNSSQGLYLRSACGCGSNSAPGRGRRQGRGEQPEADFCLAAVRHKGGQNRMVLGPQRQKGASTVKRQVDPVAELRDRDPSFGSRRRSSAQATDLTDQGRLGGQLLESRPKVVGLPLGVGLVFRLDQFQGRRQAPRAGHLGYPKVEARLPARPVHDVGLGDDAHPGQLASWRGPRPGKTMSPAIPQCPRRTFGRVQADPRLHLVEHEQDAVVVAEGPQAGQEVVQGERDNPFVESARQRWRPARSTGQTVQNGVHAVEIAESGMMDVGDQR